MYCDNCGNKLRDGAKFCNLCGEPVAEISDKPITHDRSKTNLYENSPNKPSSSGAISQSSLPTDQQYSRSQPQPVVQYQQQTYQSQPRPYYAQGTHIYHSLGGFLSFIVVMNYISGVLALLAIIPMFISYISLIKMGQWIENYAHGYTGLCVFGLIGALVIFIISATIMIRFANKIRRKESDFLGYIQSGSITLMIIGMVYLTVIILWAKSYDTYGIMGQFYGWKDLLSVFVPWLIGMIATSVYFGSSVRVRTYMGSDSYLKQSVFNKNSHPIPADGSDQPLYNYQNIDNHRINSAHQWRCDGCNNMVSSDPCPHCGKSVDKAWTCAKCGARNEGSASVCSVCYSPKELAKSSKQAVGMQDWQCPQCKKENPGYVTTCTCGCPSSMGIKLSSYSNGNAPRTPGENEWQCPACGKINANYVGTCGCGQMRP